MAYLNKLIVSSALIITTALSLFSTTAVLAQSQTGGLSDEALGLPYGAATGLASSDVRVTAARIIQVAISMVGIIALVIIVYAGFKWMTAGGNDEQIGEAKKWMTAGVIGLAIILSAYSIVSFVIRGLTTATQGSGPQNPDYYYH